VVLFPNANSDAAVLSTWDEINPVAAGSLESKTGTITSTTTLTSTGNLPAAVADNYIFHIIGSSGLEANWGRVHVTTAGNDNAIVATNAGWTNEATVAYKWQTYTPWVWLTPTAGLVASGPVQYDFSHLPRGGKYVKNLTLTSIDTSAVLHIFIR